MVECFKGSIIFYHVTIYHIKFYHITDNYAVRIVIQTCGKVSIAFKRKLEKELQEMEQKRKRLLKLQTMLTE